MGQHVWIGSPQGSDCHCAKAQLVDKLEQMDMESLKEFGEWAESEGLQIIATRVSTGSECSIIISDGYGEEVQKESAAPQAPMKDWNGGF